mmetsp:Transcript_20946/g.37916  ORF Transcript_20946/g.37916 Transcript_20946/m.37916 type:complete len:160 (-) Transcript_20946:3-482(-)
MSPRLFRVLCLICIAQVAAEVDLKQLKLGIMQKLRATMWGKLEEKEVALQKLNTTIPWLEQTIVETTLIQNELKANLTIAGSCRHIGSAGSKGGLECVEAGSHVLWNGLGNLIFGSDKASFFNFLTLSYMPIDVTLLGSGLIAMVGAGYGVWVYRVLCK